MSRKELTEKVRYLEDVVTEIACVLNGVEKRDQFSIECNLRGVWRKIEAENDKQLEKSYAMELQNQNPTNHRRLQKGE